AVAELQSGGVHLTLTLSPGSNQCETCCRNIQEVAEGGRKKVPQPIRKKQKKTWEIQPPNSVKHSSMVMKTWPAKFMKTTLS
ncbi:unnamed protein product, partial [Gulo gulo]